MVNASHAETRAWRGFAERRMERRNKTPLNCDECPNIRQNPEESAIASGRQAPV